MEMLAECACIGSIHIRHTPNTAYIRSCIYQYFTIQAFNNQYISTDLPSWFVQILVISPLPNHYINGLMTTVKPSVNQMCIIFGSVTVATWSAKSIFVTGSLWECLGVVGPQSQGGQIPEFTGPMQWPSAAPGSTWKHWRQDWERRWQALEHLDSH
jgi:hypothetical protein